jgi:hypothetical protein
MRKMRGSAFRLSIAVIAFTAIAVLSPCFLIAKDTPPSELDRGFRLLYNLDFAGAQHQFELFEQKNPANPMGPVSEAAGVLFSEFNRLGVLEAQFLEDDSLFAQRRKYEADPQRRELFEQRLTRAEDLSRAILQHNGNDRDALLAITLTNGLRADYAAMIEKRNLTSLHYTKESSKWAGQLLNADPTCYDAHLAGGVSRYVTGSMSAPVRWVLRMGGVPADKAGGIAELQLVASQGRLLAPFARILLAIAYVREKDVPRAKDTLRNLEDDFPANPLFARELTRLENPRAAK